MSTNYPTLTSLKNSNYYFWLFIVIHTLLWTVGPALLRPSVPHDTLEGITWGMQWQWGYNKHPFLTAWLCAAVTELFASVGWPVYLLAQAAVSLTFIAVWRLALNLLPVFHALVATLALEGIFFYNINSFNLTPDTLQSPIWALLTLSFYHALTQQKISYWLSTALTAVLSVCTKYQVGVLFIPMLLLLLINPSARDSFKKPGIYIALCVFLIALIPHLHWLYLHHFITVTYATEVAADYTPARGWLNHLYNPLAYIVNNVIDVLGLFILLWPFYGCGKIPLKIAKLQWQFLLFLGLGPLVVSIVLCLLSGDYFAPRWSTPYFFLLGIIIIAWLRPLLSIKNLQQFALSLILFSSLLFVGRMATFTWFPRPNSDGFLPNQTIARTIENLWHERYQQPLPYIVGSNYLVTSIMPYMQDKPDPYLNWDLNQSPWINLDELHKQGGIFIWDEGQNYTWDKNSRNNAHLTNSILQRFPNLMPQQLYTFYRMSDNNPVLIGVAILPPQTVNHHK